jgi:hypothetical protein
MELIQHGMELIQQMITNVLTAMAEANKTETAREQRYRITDELFGDHTA